MFELTKQSSCSIKEYQLNNKEIATPANKVLVFGTKSTHRVANSYSRRHQLCGEPEGQMFVCFVGLLFVCVDGLDSCLA
jgi:hypothetical protein